MLAEVLNIFFSVLKDPGIFLKCGALWRNKCSKIDHVFSNNIKSEKKSETHMRKLMLI